VPAQLAQHAQRPWANPAKLTAGQLAHDIMEIVDQRKQRGQVRPHLVVAQPIDDTDSLVAHIRVLVGQQRQHRKNSPLRHPIASDLTYTSDQPACTRDLYPPDACPSGAWQPDFDAAATGFQAYTQFDDPGLAPGASYDIVWQMTSPPDLDQAANPSIAWNSFGHTELINTPGTPQQLSAVEPRKAGVGLVFGAIEIHKKTVAEPGATVPAGPYHLTYRCTVTPDTGDPVVVRSGTAESAPGKPWRLDDIPAHATCTVYESGNHAGNSDHAKDDPLSIVVPWNATADAATATITNTFAGPTPSASPTSSHHPTPTQPGSAPPPGAGNPLPQTGTRLLTIATTGLLSVLLGAAALAAARRHRRRGNG
jgi:hypothetical protein